MPITQYVVDTNVVSHLEALVRGGIPTGATAKVVSLCRRLAAHPDITVIDDFAWIEGASFHRPEGLSPTSLVMRDLVTEILISRPVDLLSMVEELDGWTLPESYESDVRANLDQILPEMVLTVVPCYLAALVLEKRYGDHPAVRLTVGDVIAVIDVLSKELNYVPGVLLSALKLACVGTEATRTIAMRVFKTGRRSKKSKLYQPIQNALSAAWDIGVLQLLAAKLKHDVHAALVTEDKALADLAELITVTAGWVSVTTTSFSQDPGALADIRLIDEAYALRRAAAAPKVPDRGIAARVVRLAEAEVAGGSSFPGILENGIDISFPVLGFWPDDLDRVALMLRTGLDEDLSQRLSDLLGGGLEDLVARFDAAFALSNSLLEIVQVNQNVSLVEVLRPFAEVDEYARSVATVLGAFAYAHEEPYRASLYRELLCRPSCIALRLTSIVGALSMLTREWSPRIGVNPDVLVSAAVEHVIVTWPQTEADELPVAPARSS